MVVYQLWNRLLLCSNGVACHVKTLWLLAPAKLWLFTSKSANISGCLPVIENISMVVSQFQSCLSHIQILAVCQYQKITNKK